MVELASQDLLESRDGLRNGDELAGVAGEHLSDLELVFLRQLIHTKDSNDVLERLVILEDLLDTSGNVVVLVSNNVGVHDTAGGVKGIHSGVDSTFSNRSGQDSGGVQVSECGGRGRICQVVSWHVDGLHGGDGSLLGGGGTLLHATHVGGKGWLVTHSRGDTAEKGRYFGTSLGESEDVVNEEEHILTFLVTEIFSNGESSEGNTGTGTWGLVHLSVHKGDLGGFVLQGDDTTLNHLIVEIVTLTGPLSHSGKHRVSSVSLSNVVNQLHDQDSLADTGTAEETNLTSLSIGGKQVNNLDTSNQDLLLNAHVLESWGFSVDGLTLVGGNGAPLVNWISNNIDDAAKSLRTNRDHDWVASVIDNITADKTFGTVHGNGPDGVLSQVLGDLQDKLGDPVLNNEGVEDLRKSIFKLDVNNGTNDGDNLSLGEGRCCWRAY